MPFDKMTRHFDMETHTGGRIYDVSQAKLTLSDTDGADESFLVQTSHID